MRTVFEILPSSFDPETCRLLCEVSNEGFSFCIKDDEKNSFLGLGIYHFDKNRPTVGFPIALQIVFHQKEILSGNFKKVCVVYSFRESVLVPFPLYDRQKDSTIMNMMFGDLNQNQTILTDVISDESLYNIYRVPTTILEVIQNQFPDASNMHHYSLLMRKSTLGNDHLSVIFYAQKIIVCLIKDDKHQLVNTFDYQTPEDVSYVLLNICDQFKIENAHLIISGLLEENSPLYKEIYKYFNQIDLTAFPEGSIYSEEITKFPSHYFSYIFALDQCE
ncbi:MAG: DUF3822 family protein [Ginsengibacter sp.]